MSHGSIMCLYPLEVNPVTGIKNRKSVWEGIEEVRQRRMAADKGFNM